MIRYLDLQQINAMHAAELDAAVSGVVHGGWYVKGEQCEAFEQEYAHFIGTRHAIGVGNGLDALSLILRALLQLGRLQRGDEVLVPANTFIASFLAITDNGLVPVPVEPRASTFQMDERCIEQAVTPRTRALMLVHLYGHPAWTPAIEDLCERCHLLLLEDNAQAHGSIVGGRRTGSLSLAAGHSFYPGKNLGALGDAGAVTTNDDELAEAVRSLGNYGSQKKYVFPRQGRNSRLDEIQATALRVKLRYLDQDNARRRELALRYIRHVDNPLLMLPSEAFCQRSVHHIFPVLCPHRDALKEFLADHGVGTMIHYPIPPHRQACYPDLHSRSLPLTERLCDEELSIPLHQALTDAQVDRIAQLLNEFRP